MPFLFTLYIAYVKPHPPHPPLDKENRERERVGCGYTKASLYWIPFRVGTKRYPVSVNIALDDVKFLNMRNRLVLSQ